MHICIVGDPQDLSATYVSWAAQQRGIEVIELSEETLGVDWSFAFSDCDPTEGRIEKAGRCYQYSALGGAFVRLNPEPPPTPGLDLPAEEIGTLVVERRHGIVYFLNSLPFVVANRPSAGRSNGSKPYQMHMLAKAGFQVPDWIATNEREAVQEFVRTCPDGAIFKSCSGIRSKVRLLDDELLETLQSGATPVVVQEYISGVDVRIHVVAGHAFATEILSTGIDYRFEAEDNEFRPTEAPPRIEDLCHSFARTECLVIAGFDFRVNDEGRWYCLEMNPVPTFLPYEMTTGQEICDALLDVFRDTGDTLPP